MADRNEFTIEGELSAEPDVRKSKKGNLYARIRIKNEYDEKGGANYFPLTTFNPTIAGRLEELKMGTRCWVKGRLSRSTYQDNWLTDLIFEEFGILGDDDEAEPEVVQGELADDGDIPF